MSVRLIGAAIWLSAAAWISTASARNTRHGHGVPLGPAPPAVRHFCALRARSPRFPVLCPRRYPLSRRSDVFGSGSSWRKPRFYWASFNDSSGFPHGDEGHLVLGGQQPRFSLAGARGQTWPRPGRPAFVRRLPLPRLITVPMQNGKTFVAQRPPRIVGRANIGGTTALVLVAAGDPEGGLVSSHVIVVWNHDHHGYFVAPHFGVSPSGAAYSGRQRIAAALAVAGSATQTR